LVGKSAIFTGYPEAIVYSNHFTRLRVKGDLADPGFVTLWLISQWQARTFEILCNRWIGQSAVKSDKLFDLEIPLPPIAEQQRIASLLGEKIAVVEMVRQFAEEQLQAARKLPFAYLREQFSHPATNWYKVKLGQICEQDRKIIDPHSSLAKQTTYLSLEHVESITGRILREPTEQNHNEGLSTTFAFDSRHILYGKLRPYLNKVALPSFSGRCTTELIPILPKGVDKGFLAWILRRQETVDAVMQQKTGSRMPRANMEKLFSLEISLPPTDEQLRIASYLDEKITCSHNLEITLENQLTEINHMHTALLREAFTGDI
jgi:type I restriction enzyme S subunit